MARDISDHVRRVSRVTKGKRTPCYENNYQNHSQGGRYFLLIQESFSVDDKVGYRELSSSIGCHEIRLRRVFLIFFVPSSFRSQYPFDFPYFSSPPSHQSCKTLPFTRRLIFHQNRIFYCLLCSITFFETRPSDFSSEA